MRGLNCQKRVVGGIGGRYSGCCCKGIDFITGFILINGNKGLYKIVFCQTLAAGIDSNKNVCYIFFVCGIADLQRGQRIIREIEKRIDIIFDSIFFLVGQQREFFFTASFIGLFDETTPERTNGICRQRI